MAALKFVVTSGCDAIGPVCLRGLFLWARCSKAVDGLVAAQRWWWWCVGRCWDGASLG